MDLTPLLQSSPVIQIHAVLAMLALLLGAVQLFRRKGDERHRMLGRLWVGAMVIVAVSSFFIWTIRLWGLFSPIHLLSIFTLVMLWRGVTLARQHKIEAHRWVMQMTYLLALVVTGLLTFYPGRTMYRVAFGPEGATPLKLVLFAAVLVVIAAGAALVARWRRTPQGTAFVAGH